MIPVFRPFYGEDEAAAVRDVLLSGWVGLGPKTKEFEEKFASYVGSRFAVGVNSCTAALHLALIAAGVKGGEVIVPALTFVSTALAVVYVGAEPVFADVEEDTLCLDPKDVERKVTARTRAIIPVHYGGHPCDMDAIKSIAEENNLIIIEDAAHACGAEYKGKKVGSLTDLTCFSFHAVKNLATGDGGMITTNDEQRYERLQRLRWVGIDADTWKRAGKKAYSWYYEVTEVGYKYHMNDITAAIGLVQLQKLDAMNELRREICRTYTESFSDLDWLTPPVERAEVKSACHNYVIRVPERERLRNFLNERGIASGVHYLPLHLHPVFQGCQADVPVTMRVWDKLLTLPVYAGLTREDQQRVIDAVRDFGTTL